MSRVHFHTPTAEAELHGSERAWLDHLARGIANAAWDLDATASFALNRAVEIIAMSPEPEPGEYGANYLHKYMREAQAQKDRNDAAVRSGGYTDYEPESRFVDAVRTALECHGFEVDVAGARFHTRNIGLNTALVAGSDLIRLAAKIHGWCESFCWFDGPDRAWLADLIGTGLDAGLYRRGIHFQDGPGGERKWASQGWEEVQALLRSRDDEPVVLSYSGGESFPDADCSDWMPPWPVGVPKRWDALTEEQQAEREQLNESWYDLNPAEQWERGMRWLMAHRPWAQITPDNLASTTFGPPVTIYDLFAPDRDERIRAAMEVGS